VLVLGAFGEFGRRITETLCRTTDLPVIAAGRRVPEVLEDSGNRMRTLRINAEDMDAGQLAEIKPAMVIDTVGPFQNRDRKLARLCIDLGVHYVDLADGREFVAGVSELNGAALRSNTLVVSGASTVPALSSAVVKHLASIFSVVEEIEIGIAPGCLGPRGLATMRSVLGYVGRPIPIWSGACVGFARGWSDSRRHSYPPPIGPRYLSLIDVPDNTLLPLEYPELRQLSVRAGYEVPAVHHALGMLGFLVSVGLIGDLPRHARLLQRLSGWFDRFGSKNGAMHVRLRGFDSEHQPITCTWTLTAECGHGPQIPATAAVLFAKKLLHVPGYAPIGTRGALPAFGLLSLQEFKREWLDLRIRTQESCDTAQKSLIRRSALEALSRHAP
jgi:hypothetical protein